MAARALWRLLRLATVLALAVAAAPVTLVAVVCAATAWWLGWPPRRLYFAAAWCLPMVAVWLVATGLGAGAGAGLGWTADGAAWAYRTVASGCTQKFPTAGYSARHYL